MLSQNTWIKAVMLTAALLVSNALFATEPGVEADEAQIAVYDDAAYTEYVESTMKKLDKLYLEFCDRCGVDATKARMAKEEFLVIVRGLAQHMNARYDNLDPKKGAALSPTETLVSVHALTMLVDILAATELEQMAAHPYIE
jgi:hypothetical protein